MLISGNPRFNMSKTKLMIYLLSPQISSIIAVFVSVDPPSQHPSNYSGQNLGVSNLGCISFFHIPHLIHQQHLLALASENIRSRSLLPHSTPTTLVPTIIISCLDYTPSLQEQSSLSTAFPLGSRAEVPRSSEGGGGLS